MSDEIAQAVREHADKIMTAAGSSLRHYEGRSKTAILAAVMDCYEAAYRAGAAHAAKFTKEGKDDNG